MISHIKGIIREINETALLLKCQNLTYNILIPHAICQTINKDYALEDELELVIYHYIQQDQSKGIPVLVGFLNEIEKDFFEQFISVSGIGPKAAVKALKDSLSHIASAIDRSDEAFLKKLPGIGSRKAREIVAKLQGRIGKYGLIQDGHVATQPISQPSLKEEALCVLIQLQYKKREAEEMIDKALERNGNVKTIEELLNEVYRQKALV